MNGTGTSDANDDCGDSDQPNHRAAVASGGGHTRAAPGRRKIGNESAGAIWSNAETAYGMVMTRDAESTVSPSCAFVLLNPNRRLVAVTVTLSSPSVRALAS